MSRSIALYKGDITALAIDAIVNAANRSLLGGGGVDGAIHRGAGPELKQYCAGLGGCDTGKAKISPAFRLPAKHVIHTVGPVWHGGDKGEPSLLRDCYLNSLDLAQRNECREVAFPAISCGVYGYPLEQAAAIAVDSVQTFLSTHDVPRRVILCAFDDTLMSIYRQLLPDAPSFNTSQ